MVVDTGGEDPAVSGVATTGDGVLVNSGPYDGLRKDEAIERIVADLEARGGGTGAINFRLRDWLVSRQRFWGPPIPMVHCGRAVRWRSRTTSCPYGCRICGVRR
jgi:leucyl-tRNA synthetase